MELDEILKGHQAATNDRTASHRGRSFAASVLKH